MISYIKDPSIILKALGARGFLNWVPDEIYIKILYFLHEKRILNLDNPILLNEKLQWLKLYDRNVLYTDLVDKIKVKDVVSRLIGEEYIIPTLDVYDSPEKINFEKLPSSFILKTNHNSHCLVICKNKASLDKNQTFKILGRGLKSNGFLYAREWPYKNVKPKILAEKLISNQDNSPLVDYKFYCYGGKPIYFMYSIGEAENNVRNHKFNMNMESIDYLFKKTPTLNINDIILPSNFSEMKEIVEILCRDMQHVRIDLYNVDGHVYFGEITFYSSGGFLKIDSDEYSRYLSSLIDLKKVERR